MKKAYLTIAILVIGIMNSLAQSPDLFHYQAIARDALGDVVTNQEIHFRISILKDHKNGTPVYVESRLDTTNAFGLIDFHIGAGTVESGDLASIPWENSTYFLKVEMDIQGGNRFEDMGTVQMVSVPYASYAAKAGNVFSGNYSDLTNKPDMSDYVLIPQTNTWDKDTTNELQSLSLNGYTLHISGKNKITLPDSIRMAKYAANPAGSFKLTYQQILDKPMLSIKGDTIYLTDGGSVILPDTILFAAVAGAPAESFVLDFSKVVNAPYIDSDTTNELQVLSISSDTLFLSHGNYVVLPDSVTYAQNSGSSERIESRLDSLIATLDSINAAMTAKSNTFWTSDTNGFFIDERDNQRYNFGMIGDQVWMTENLNYGDTLETAELPASNDTIEKYAYDDDPLNLDAYGGLYTWREMMQLPDSCLTKSCQDIIQTHHQGVCPSGWHIPSQAEWQQLTGHLGGNPGAGGALKETGTIHWDSPNTGATNTAGFSGVGGGKKSGGFYLEMKITAHMGTTNENGALNTYTYQLRYDSDALNYNSVQKEVAFSVRCIKNE